MSPRNMDTQKGSRPKIPDRGPPSPDATRKGGLHASNVSSTVEPRINNPHTNNPRFFQVFSKLIYQLCDDLESLSYATTSVLNDFLADGVQYLELRTIPRASPTKSITKEAYLDTILNTISTFKANPDNKSLSVFLILALDRGSTTPAQAKEIIDLAIANKTRGVVGVDLCGNPTQGDVSLYRDAFAQAKEAGLGLTLHFAETTQSGRREELETLLSFQPDRLGHVIHVPDDLKVEIGKRKIGLELCMSCNVHAKLIEGGFLDHHFGYWRHEECPIALCVSLDGYLFWGSQLVVSFVGDRS